MLFYVKHCTLLCSEPVRFYVKPCTVYDTPMYIPMSDMHSLDPNACVRTVWILNTCVRVCMRACVPAAQLSGPEQPTAHAAAAAAAADSISAGSINSGGSIIKRPGSNTSMSASYFWLGLATHTIVCRVRHPCVFDSCQRAAAAAAAAATAQQHRSSSSKSSSSRSSSSSSMQNQRRRRQQEQQRQQR